MSPAKNGWTTEDTVWAVGLGFVCSVWLECSLLGAIKNALYKSSGRSLHRPTYAYY